MAENKKGNWDEWIKKATDAAGGSLAKTAMLAGGGSPVAASLGTYFQAAYNKGKADAEKAKRPKSKDYQSMKDVKRIK